MFKKNPALIVGIITLALLIAFVVYYMVKNRKVVLEDGTTGVEGDPIVNEPSQAEAVEKSM